MYRLAGEDIAGAIESLAVISPLRKSFRGAQEAGRSEATQQLRAARTCYDHLAGHAAVLLHDSLLESGYLVYSGKNEYAITPHGRVWLAALGMDLNHSASRSPFARSCLDWSERKPHLAGRLAAQLLDSFFEQRWIVRIRETRAVRITERGIREFERQYGLRLDRAARRATRF